MRATFMILLLAGTVCAAPVVPDNALERLAAWLPGSFSNKTQARSDFNFHDVALHVVPIWPDRADGPWFYLEQALAHAPNEPYRQQVYQLAAGHGGSVEVRVFNLPDPIALTATWHDPARLNALSPEQLVACPGCTLDLKSQHDGSFQGATGGRGCVSELGGAAYATTELTVTADGLVLWDRGFTSNGTQVWGPAAFGFVFKRVE